VPELPEVETLRRGLEREALGRRITGVIIANPKTLKGQSEAFFCARVLGGSVQRVDRRGKYLLIPLAATVPDTPSVSLCIHLKMRGQLLLEDAAAPAGPYHCATLILDNGRVIRFCDMWAWGEMRALTAEEMGGIAGLSGMGAEPLEPSWNGKVLAAALATRKGPIKPALLDQRVVAGVGNIYADESLFQAGIHPERSAAALSPTEADRLADAIRAVLREAVEGGGATSDNYVDTDGLRGRYTPRVYERGGAPCHACGAFLRRIRLGGRGTVFCPKCQS
jgi:formamidopyrimidine-DNA glycosylase